MNDAHMRDGSVIDAISLTSPRLYENTLFLTLSSETDLGTICPHAGPKILPLNDKFTVHPVAVAGYMTPREREIRNTPYQMG